MAQTARYASKEQEQYSGQSSEELAARTEYTLAINSSKYMTFQRAEYCEIDFSSLIQLMILMGLSLSALFLPRNFISPIQALRYIFKNVTSLCGEEAPLGPFLRKETARFKQSKTINLNQVNDAWMIRDLNKVLQYPTAVFQPHILFCSTDNKMTNRKRHRAQRQKRVRMSWRLSNNFAHIHLQCAYFHAGQHYFIQR